MQVEYGGLLYVFAAVLHVSAMVWASAPSGQSRRTKAMRMTQSDEAQNRCRAAKKRPP